MQIHFRRTMRSTRLLTVFVCLCMGLFANAQPQTSGDKLPLWTVEGNGNRLYLLGSVHMLREADHPLPAEVYDAYDDADALIMELDITAIDPVATQTLVNELGMIRDGKQLGDLLGTKDYTEAQRLAERINVPLAMLASAKPWFAAITIDALMLMRVGFSPANGVEMRLAERAATDGKRITGLETERQQLEFLDQLSPGAQRDLLLQTLAEGETLDSSMNDLIAAWRRGDTEWLESDLLQEIRQYPEIYQTIVVRRNRNWIEQIVGLFDDGQNYLVIVGAMHMIGEDGIPALLRNLGYEVRQLSRSNQNQTSTISKSSLPAPQSGQRHDNGTSSQRVPASIPDSGSPSSSS